MFTRNRSVLYSWLCPFSIALVTMHFGCARPQAQAAQPEQTGANLQEVNERQPLCPTDLPDVRAEVQDLERGVSIAFTTQPDSIEEVRALTRQMALSYQRCQEMMRQRPRAPMRRGRTAAHHKGMMRQQRRGPMHMMLGTDIQVREMADGAEIIMQAQDPKHVNAIRARERWHVEMMRLGHCPMMGMIRELEE